jgi:hypothetical protein
MKKATCSFSFESRDSCIGLAIYIPHWIVDLAYVSPFPTIDRTTRGYQSIWVRERPLYATFCLPARESMDAFSPPAFGGIVGVFHAFHPLPESAPV